MAKRSRAEMDDEERTVAILFLAHDGVTNPTVWQKWRSSQEVGSLFRLSVRSGPRLIHGPNRICIRNMRRGSSSSSSATRYASCSPVAKGCHLTSLRLLAGYQAPQQLLRRA
jgi:sulfur relay (sulfurtransferase) complex TusBCD TusD component (DsrE family)